MIKKIFWDRRSGIDRRQVGSSHVDRRRESDRRQSANNGYMLIVGDNGLDSFELLVLVPVIMALSCMLLGHYLGTL